MSRLVDAEFTTTWKPKLSYQAITSILDRVATNLLFLQLSDKRLQVITHQKEFMPASLFGGMHSDFRWWQSEDQPAIPGIDVGKFEHITEEDTVSLSVRAVNDRMRTNNHSNFLGELRYGI
jgi:hypothetical protein